MSSAFAYLLERLQGASRIDVADDRWLCALVGTADPSIDTHVRVPEAGVASFFGIGR
jgi:hypothetical protein